MQRILVHGLGQSRASWEEVRSLMLEQDKVSCPDLSLFLESGDVTYSNLYRAFSDYCNRSLEPFNLCGLSLGAVLALNYAIDYPEKVKSLVLIAGQYKMPKALLKLQNIIFRFIPKKFFNRIGYSKNDFICLTTSMMNLNFSNQLANISCPVVIICGEKDYANKKASNILVKLIETAAVQFVKNAGHEVNVDAPKELAEILNSFYSR